MRRRIVVTGIGTVTSIGIGRQALWDNLLAGKSGVSVVESLDTSRYNFHLGGEVKGFEPDGYVQRLNSSCIGRASQFGIAAARLALQDARLDVEQLDRERVGVSVGTTSGEPQVLGRFDELYVAGKLDEIGSEAGVASIYPPHVIAGHIAGELGLGGVNITIPCACAAGNYAIAHAFDELTSARADLMLAGGSDAFSRVAFTGFTRVGAVAPEICQPFDRKRKGMIPGEGAAMVVLEPLERALERGACIYAEVAGYGLSCDAYHMTSAHPEGDGAVRAMKTALADTGFEPSDVSYISAHGTGTPTNDRLETLAVKRVFGDDAYKTPISSIKSMLGHTMGAASAIEAAVCAMTIFCGRIPPTMNFQEQDPECDLDYVPNQARERDVKVAMNNAYAFGGNNSTLILKRCEV